MVKETGGREWPVQREGPESDVPHVSIRGRSCKCPTHFPGRPARERTRRLIAKRISVDAAADVGPTRIGIECLCDLSTSPSRLPRDGATTKRDAKVPCHASPFGRDGREEGK